MEVNFHEIPLRPNWWSNRSTWSLTGGGHPPTRSLETSHCMRCSPATETRMQSLQRGSTWRISSRSVSRGFRELGDIFQILFVAKLVILGLTISFNPFSCFKLQRAAPENCSFWKKHHTLFNPVTKQTHKPAKAASSCSKILGQSPGKFLHQHPTTWRNLRGKCLTGPWLEMQSLDFQLLSLPSSRSYSTLGNSAHLRWCGRFGTTLSFMGDFEAKTW